MKSILVLLFCACVMATSRRREEGPRIPELELEDTVIENVEIPDEDPVKGIPYYPKGLIGKEGVGVVNMAGIVRVKGCGLGLIGHHHKGCHGYGIKGRLMMVRMHGVMIPLGYGHGIGLGKGLGLGLGKGLGLGLGIGGLGLGKGFGLRGKK